MTGVLRLRGAACDFIQGDEVVHALHPTDLEVDAGEFVGVLGPSGSGKSTLLTVMGGLRSPSRGGGTRRGRTVLDTTRGRPRTYPAHRHRVHPSDREPGAVFDGA